MNTPDPLIDETDPRLTGKSAQITKIDIRRDDKGRLDPKYMTPDEKIDEILVSMRAAQDLISGFIESMQGGGGMMGMVKGLMGGGGIMGNRG